MIELPAGFLRGSYTPLVTPFSDDQVDHDRYAALVERQIEGGSNGIVVAGTTGEPAMLTAAERTELVRTAVSAAAGRIPVVAATGSQSLSETIELCADAERAGADALLVVTPYYTKPPQRGLVAYFDRVAASTELPILIYHIPGRAAVNLSVESVVQITRVAPNLVGMKHASPDLGYASQLLRALGPDFRLLVGLEELSLPLLSIGAAGLVNAVGNIAPREVAALCTAVFAGDMQAARRANDLLVELNEAVFWDTNPIPIKYLMTRMGLLLDNEHRLPMVKATPELERRLDDLLVRFEAARLAAVAAGAPLLHGVDPRRHAQPDPQWPTRAGAPDRRL
jgi:4-hydroxy-tetrahydrodipicolinate synthase